MEIAIDFGITNTDILVSNNTERIYSSIQSEEINPAVMKENWLVKYSLRPIKILGDGEIDKKMNVTASAFSSSAKSKIEKAGGTVEVQ